MQATRTGAAKAKSLLERALAALVLVTIPFGPLITLGSGGRSLSISLSQVATVILAYHLVLKRMHVASAEKSGIGKALAIAALMVIPVLVAPNFGSAAVAFFNYSTGLLGGVLIGTIWAREQTKRFGIVDAGLALFLLAASMQLLFSFSGTSVSSLHQSAQTPWGNSNYVAACLVVGAFALIGRGLFTRTLPIIAVPAGLALVAALLTLSRGAAVSMALAIAVLLWSSPASPWVRTMLRGLAVCLPVVAVATVNLLEGLRYAGTAHAATNIDSRLALFETAWSDFMRSPLVGNGWLSFRSVSAEAVEEQSFAHNVVLSFLQMGGILFGATTLMALCYLLWKAIRRNAYMAPALFAGIAISMSDPFFEGTVGNVLVLSAATYALSSAPIDQAAWAGRISRLPKSAPSSQLRYRPANSRRLHLRR